MFLLLCYFNECDECHKYPSSCSSHFTSSLCSSSCMHAKSLQLCLTLCNTMHCSLPGSSVHRILQARILEWVATLINKSFWFSLLFYICPCFSISTAVSLDQVLIIFSWILAIVVTWSPCLHSPTCLSFALLVHMVYKVDPWFLSMAEKILNNQALATSLP